MSLPWILAALGLLWSAPQASAATASEDLVPVALSDQGVSLQVELSHLESRLRAKDLTPKQSQRLAEIYFLTSRCEEALKIKRVEKTDLSCVCGGSCPQHGSVQKIIRLRDLFNQGVSWFDPKVQAAWRAARNFLEARYFAMKFMRKVADPGVVAERAEFEHSFESLEVK